MVRKFQNTDINETADIWLKTNITAHDFIPAQYWQENYENVKAMLLQAQLYVYEEKAAHKIQGFIGLQDGYIAGIFVRDEAQSGGIGKRLLDFVKGIRPELSLHVYKKNARAVQFYLREHFRVEREELDENTQEKEYLMRWRA